MGIIGGVVGAAGSIVGGIAAAKSAQQQAEMVQAQRDKNQNWMDRRYNEDATQRADAQRLITMTEESIKQRNKASAGAAAVMGASTESVAAAKAVNNQVLADTNAQIAAGAEARKDNIEATYMQNDNAFSAQQQQAEAKKQGAIAEAVVGLGKTVAQIPL